MSTLPTPQHDPKHDPTMEEILASIRRIIAEDHPEPDQHPEPVLSHMERPQKQNHASADILELTEEVPPDDAAAPESPLLAAGDAAVKRTATTADDLISDTARHAMGRAFARLDSGAASKPVSTAGGSTLEAVFARAVGDALTPILHHWVDSHKAEIMEDLRPLIREWMDDHLPRLIEIAVQREIGRLTADRLRPR